MLITCHNCETIFQIDKSKIAQKGQQVKCSVCAHVWTIFPDNEEETNTPKLNLNRNEDLSTEATTQKLQGPKHRQDILEKNKNKKSNFLAFLIWLFIICMVLVLAIFALITYRATVTAYYPKLSTFFELAGININYSSESLAIKNLQTDWKDDILRVRGDIFNNGSMRVHTLPVKITVIDPSGLLLSTHEIWPDSITIDASEYVPFFAQITIDADEKAEIQVDFLSYKSK